MPVIALGPSGLHPGVPAAQESGATPVPVGQRIFLAQGNKVKDT